MLDNLKRNQCIFDIGRDSTILARKKFVLMPKGPVVLTYCDLREKNNIIGGRWHGFRASVTMWQNLHSKVGKSEQIAAMLPMREGSDGLIHDTIFHGYCLLQGDLGHLCQESQRSWRLNFEDDYHSILPLDEDFKAAYNLAETSSSSSNAITYG